MKKIIALLPMIALALCAAAGPKYIKVMSYNIRNANGLDNCCNIQRVANVINSVDRKSVV